MVVTCDAPTAHYDTGCKLLLHYDADNNGLINLDELTQCYNDYENGIITEAEFDFVSDAYINGGINVVCSSCYIQPPTQKMYKQEFVDEIKSRGKVDLDSVPEGSRYNQWYRASHAVIYKTNEVGGYFIVINHIVERNPPTDAGDISFEELTSTGWVGRITIDTSYALARIDELPFQGILITFESVPAGAAITVDG